MSDEQPKTAERGAQAPLGFEVGLVYSRGDGFYPRLVLKSTRQWVHYQCLDGEGGIVGVTRFCLSSTMRRWTRLGRRET